jgi:lysyl endopeptidase
VSKGRVHSLGPSTLASGSFIRVRYIDAPTEGGSSGSGVFIAGGGQFLLRGGLLGGASECATVGDLDDPDNEDVYSRLDLAFPNLQQFLQPTSTPPPGGTVADYSGAWSNPAQDGWGLIVVRGGTGTYAMYIYHYGENGKATWYLSPGALSGTRFSHPALGFDGPWFGAPFNPSLVAPRVAGDLQVDFTSATSASIRFTLDGRTVNTTLQKLSF